MDGNQEVTRPLPPKGMSYCSRGRHLAPVDDFYMREGGKLSSWCKACSTLEAKQSKDRKMMVAMLVKKITDEEDKPRDIEEQTIIHSHVSNLSNLKIEVKDYPPATLDWLTPIWGFQERSKLEQ